MSHASLEVLQFVIKYSWGVLTFSTNTENDFCFHFLNSTLVCVVHFLRFLPLPIDHILELVSSLVGVQDGVDHIDRWPMSL